MHACRSTLEDPTYKAIADAVVHDNLHVVWIRGNHDIRLVDSSEIVKAKTTLRDHFLGEITRLSGLNEQQAATFRTRVGFAGHMAPLGEFGEMVVLHGEHTDPTNSWRNPANPYSYTKAGAGVIERTLGDNVVRDLWQALERDDPELDNRAGSFLNGTVWDILRHPSRLFRIVKLFWDASRHRITTTEGQELAERIDDRHALKYWVDRTGFADMMNRPLRKGDPPRHFTSAQIARILDHIYAETAAPVHEQMTSKGHLVNALRLAFAAGRTLHHSETAEPKLLSLLTTTTNLPNVRYVVWGHDHKERARNGNVPGKGEVGFFDSGTWTMARGKEMFEVVEAHTDATGRIVDDVKALRVDPSTGVPSFTPQARTEKHPVPGWE